MSKKLITIIIILVVIGLAFFFLLLKNDGSTNESGDGTENPIFDFGGNQNPDGGQPNNTNNDGKNNPNGDVLGNIPKLRKISFKEISGYGVFAEGATTTVRFVDRETGNIFETSTKTLSSSRVTNTTILKTTNSWWLDKNTLLLRFVDGDTSVKSYLATIPEKGSEDDNPVELGGTFLENGITDLDVFGSEIFYLRKEGEGSLGIILNSKNESSEVIFSTPLKEILVDFYSKNSVLINTKPSYFSNGSVFRVGRGEGTLKEVVGPRAGLYATPSKDGGGLVYSKTEQNGTSLWISDDEGERRLGKSTLAEKCSWSESGVIYCAVPRNTNYRNLPDRWYKGKVSFVDEIWSIDTKSGEEELLVSPQSEFGLSADIVDIKIDETENNLFFVNKTDGTLWSFSLEDKAVKESLPDENE